MSLRFSEADAAALGALHVTRAWFARLDLPSGVSFLHSGVGTVVLEGDTYRGVTDPISGRLVSLGAIEEPAFGQAAALTVILSGVDVEFMRSVRADARAIEGRRADVWFCLFDQETQTPIGSKVAIFTRGIMSAPGLVWSGLGQRTVTLTIENVWNAKNFAPGGRWNAADQQRRFPGDLGGQFIGVKVSEPIK